MTLLASSWARWEEEGIFMEHKWIIVRTFNRHERILSEFLKQEGLTCFVPMQFKERLNKDNTRSKKILEPIIHDYIFLEKSLPMDLLEAILSKSRIPLYVLKTRETDHVSEIPNREMVEFRMLCDPDFEGQLVLKTAQDNIKVGKEVEIIHGPFTGIRGRLYRKQKHYWFVKTVAGLTVELRITRWFCKPIEGVKCK